MKTPLQFFVLLLFVLAISVFTGCSSSNSNDLNWVHNSDYDFPIYVGSWGCVRNTSEDSQYLGYYWFDGSNYPGPDSLAWTVIPYDGKDNSHLNSILSSNAIQNLIGIQHINEPDLKYNSTILMQKDSNHIKGLNNNQQRGDILPGTPTTVNPNGLGGVVADFILTSSSDADTIQYTWLDQQANVFSLFPGLYPNASYFGMQLNSAESCTMALQTPMDENWYIIAYNGTINHATPYPTQSGTSFITLNFQDNPSIALIFSKDFDPLGYPPPNFSTFTAIFNPTQFLITLQWSTESETDMYGFNIFRSDDANIANAVQINSNIIPGTNTSTTHNYNYSDTNIQASNSYWYWLQLVSLSGEMNFWGPVMVPIDSPEVIPEENSLNYAYPNPTNGDCILPLSLKQSSHVTILIVNRQGDIIKTLVNTNYDAGVHHFLLNMSDIPVGVYRAFYWIEQNGHSYYAYGDVQKN
jgi:hypothetical protein